MTLITLKDAAVSELKALLATKGAGESAGLRLGVQRGGCAGLQYTLQVGDRQDGDEVVEQDGVRIFLAPDSLDYLRGCLVDFSSDLSDSGFKIVNPNASRSCGCGTSFEPKDEPLPAGDDPSMGETECR